MDAAVEYIDAALDLFRSKGLPIVWVRDREDVKPGEEGFELIDALVPCEDEHEIIKEYGNTFNRTDCCSLLRNLNVDTIIMTGYCAEYCVLSSYRGALDLDFVPILFRGSIASGKEENLRFVESISDIVSYGALRKLLEAV